MFGILLLVVVKMENKWRIFLASIMDHSTIICDEVIKSFDGQINFNEKKAVCKTQNFHILFAFLIIAIALLIAVNIYCYVIKYQRKHLLQFHNTNNKLIKFYIDRIN